MQAWLYEFNSETFIYVVLCNQIVGTEWKWWGNGDTPLTCLVSGRGKWWIFLVGGGERCTQLLCPQRRQDLLRGRRSWAAHREGEHQGSAQWQIAGWWLWVIWGWKGPTWGESDSEHLLLHGDFCRLFYPQLFKKRGLEGYCKMLYVFQPCLCKVFIPVFKWPIKAPEQSLKGASLFVRSVPTAFCNLTASRGYHLHN